MDTVGFAPSFDFKQESNHIDSIERKQSFTSSDEYSNDTMPTISGVMSINSSKSEKRSKSQRTSLVVYGPILVRKRQTAAPTLATGRRSKDVVYEGEAAEKHEIRRKKNRESARNLKKLRDNIEHELEAKVNELETEERDLSTKIDTLQVYKQYLQKQCQQSSSICNLIPRTSSLEVDGKRQRISQTVPIRHVYTEIKEEPHSPPEQWQLLFSI